MADLTTKFASLTLKNPVTTASGTCGYGLEYANFYDLDKLGAVIVKGIRMTPCDGNPMPRVCETAGGMINAIGLQGPGVEAFLHDARYLPALKTRGVPVIVNIWGTSVEEYAEVASALDGEDGVSALEVNISCPNVKAGGAAFGTRKELAADVVRAVRHATKRPVIVKLSPNVADITEFARAAEAEGADAISLINTLSAMAIDIETRKPRIANVTGGLSGPAVKPVAVRMVYQCHRAVKLPILGMGGISCGADAVEFLLAGATAVSVGTANFTDPETPMKVLAFLDEYLDRHRIKSVRELVGALEM